MWSPPHQTQCSLQCELDQVFFSLISACHAPAHSALWAPTLLFPSWERGMGLEEGIMLSGLHLPWLFSGKENTYPPVL